MTRFATRRFRYHRPTITTKAANQLAREKVKATITVPTTMTKKRLSRRAFATKLSFGRTRWARLWTISKTPVVSTTVYSPGEPSDPTVRCPARVTQWPGSIPGAVHEITPSTIWPAAAAAMNGMNLRISDASGASNTMRRYRHIGMKTRSYTR